MKPRDRLKKALRAIDWKAHISEFLADEEASSRASECNLRIAIWSRQLDRLDEGNPALPFIREMQSAGHFVSALLALALYRPAAAAIRGSLEAALYYTYFRAHPRELATLVRNDKFYVSKGDILEYHKLHSPRFSECQNALNLNDRLTAWYGRLSAILHGQIPGMWHYQRALSNLGPDPTLRLHVIDMFCDGER